MIRFFERFLGQPVRHYDYTWVRSVGRGHGTPPHYDIVYMGRGTWNLWTVWTPIGDVTWDQGGLMVIPGTHKHERLLNGYAKRDVDTYCLTKPGTGWNSPGSEGWLSHDPVGVRRGLKAPWHSAEYRAGDVVVFSTVLVHGGLDNQSDRIRLSTDSRYQPASEPADERWIGVNPPAHGPNAKRGLIC
jgi:ectoine hydroxylase-related dioxygenase (phytanoyl-CoA dioxygenase family)